MASLSMALPAPAANAMDATNFLRSISNSSLLSILEQELQRKLADPWAPRRSHLPKIRVGDTAARIIELSMVEDVEKLEPELNDLRFRDRNLGDKSEERRV